MSLKFRAVSEIAAEIYKSVYSIYCLENGDLLEKECRLK